MTTRARRVSFGTIALAACLAASLLAVLLHSGEASAAELEAVAASSAGPYDELLQLSLAERRGLTFFVAGQTLPGVVTRQLGDAAVEVRNQTHDRIVVRLDRVDAVALN